LRESMNLKIIELFAGTGSQHRALKNLNIDHEVVAISEIDKYAVQSYTALHGQPNNLGDITKIQELPKADLWTYSFPCQDISVAGKQAGIKEGTRSGLLYEVERLLLNAKENNTLPKYLLLENVKNLVGQRHKPDFDKWLDFLNGLGYWSYWQVLNAKDYGIPQNRERVFVVSILGGGYYKFPEKIPLKLMLNNIVEFLPKYKVNLEKLTETQKVCLKKVSTEIKRKTISKTVRASGFNSYDKHTWNIYGIRLEQSPEYTKVIKNISKTLNANKHDGGYAVQKKDNVDYYFYSPKECLRLMGWKDTEIDKVIACGMSNSQMYKQAGNGIVVNVLEAIFRELFLKETKEHEVNQVNFALTNQIKTELEVD